MEQTNTTKDEECAILERTKHELEEIIQKQTVQIKALQEAAGLAEVDEAGGSGIFNDDSEGGDTDARQTQKDKERLDLNINTHTEPIVANSNVGVDGNDLPLSVSEESINAKVNARLAELMSEKQQQ